MPVRCLLIDRPADVATAARAVRAGGVVATAFGNFYAIIAEPSATAVRGVNLAKGRPADQVGSITTTVERIPAMFDWAQLSPLLDGTRLRGLMSALAALGPIGFRGPAAPGLPQHLTQVDGGVRTTQVISPGASCPANSLFARAGADLGADHLYVTSANRSRHHTGAAEEPAHWTAAGISTDFAHVPGLTVIAHRDEQAARSAYPYHLPMSVTLVSFHDPVADATVPTLTVDRHGSMHVDDVRRVAAPYGLGIRLGATAATRLPMRSYDLLPG